MTTHEAVDGQIPTVTNRQRCLVVVDVENIVDSASNANRPIDFAKVRDAARSKGNVLFSYAFVNCFAMSARIHFLDALAIAGFEIVHCPPYPLPNGNTKDSVDEHLKACIIRHLDTGRFDRVLIASHDRDYIPLVHIIKDRGVQCTMITTKRNTVYHRITDVVYLENGEFVSDDEAIEWTPDRIIGDLRELPLLTPDAHQTTIARIDVAAPFIARILRVLLQQYYRAPRHPSFNALLDFYWETIFDDDRRCFTKEQLKDFLTALVNIGVFERRVVRTADGKGGFTWYVPNRQHPFHAAAFTRSPGPRPNVTAPEPPQPPAPTPYTYYVAETYDAETYDASGWSNAYSPPCPMVRSRVFKVIAPDEAVACRLVAEQLHRSNPLGYPSADQARALLSAHDRLEDIGDTNEDGTFEPITASEIFELVDLERGGAPAPRTFRIRNDVNDEELEVKAVDATEAIELARNDYRNDAEAMETFDESTRAFFLDSLYVVEQLPDGGMQIICATK